MSILKPTLGELLDRYSILLIKAGHDPEGTPKSEELSAVEHELCNRGPAMVVAALAITLGVTNFKLWELRDRALEEPILLRDGDAGNNIRRDIIRDIDKVGL